MEIGMREEVPEEEEDKYIHITKTTRPSTNLELSNLARRAALWHTVGCLAGGRRTMRWRVFSSSRKYLCCDYKHWIFARIYPLYSCCGSQPITVVCESRISICLICNLLRANKMSFSSVGVVALLANKQRLTLHSWHWFFPSPHFFPF